MASSNPALNEQKKPAKRAFFCIDENVRVYVLPALMTADDFHPAMPLCKIRAA